MNSTFHKDLKIEHEIAKYLDKHLYTEPTFSKCIRPDDLDSQHKGIDVILSSSKFNIYDAKVDEKCTSHYVNCDIPTFAFELLYYKNGEKKVGWFLNKEKETEYYNLIWPFAYPASRTGRFDDFQFSSISGIRYMIVKKSAIIDYLNKHEFNHDRIISELRCFIKSKEERSTYDNRYHFYMRKSNQYAESPINLIIDRSELKKMAIVSGIIGTPKLKRDW